MGTRPGELGAGARQRASSRANTVPWPDRHGFWLGWADGGSSSMGLARADQIHAGEWVEEEISGREREKRERDGGKREREKEKDIIFRVFKTRIYTFCDFSKRSLFLRILSRIFNI